MTNVVIDISTLNQTFLSHLVFLDVDKYSVLFFLFLEFHKNVNINLFTILIIFEGTGTAVAEYTICEIIKCFITVTLPYNDRFIIQYNTIQYNTINIWYAPPVRIRAFTNLKYKCCVIILFLHTI